MKKQDRRRTIAAQRKQERSKHRARLRKEQLQRARQTRRQEKHIEDERALSQAHVTLRAPEVISLYRRDTHRNICDFLQQLKVSIFHEGKRVCIDFSRTRRLVSDGMLLIFAEVENILRAKPASITCRQANDHLVNEVLQHLGFLGLFGVKSSFKPKAIEAVTWNVRRGRLADLEATGRVLERSADDRADLASQLYVGLQEAATNTVNHAYIGRREDGFGPPVPSGSWWTFFRADRLRQRFSVSMCDLGVGIPRTFGTRGTEDERHSLREALRSLLTGTGLLQPHDGHLIHAAVESKRSRTGKGWRGKGLGQIRNVVDRTGGGRLVIFSNSGAYQVWRKGTQPDEETTVSYGESIYGTLICWSVPWIRIGEKDG